MSCSPDASHVPARLPPDGAQACERAAALVRIHRRGPRATVIGLTGEFDLVSTPDAEEAVLAAVTSATGGAGTTVVLDLDRVRLLGACGVRMLLAAAERARGAGATVAVVAAPGAPAVRTLRCLPDVDLPIHPTVAEALADAVDRV